MLRTSLERSGLSQRAFARALGTSHTRFSTYLAGTTQPTAQFLVRAVRLSRALQAARDAGVMSAPATALAIRKHHLTGEITWMWRMLLQGRDHLRFALEAGDQELIDAWEAQPTLIDAAQWDALLAALARHEHDRAGIEPPAWTRTEPLAEPWTPEHPFLSPARVKAQTPAWLSGLNIYVPERDLVTA